MFGNARITPIVQTPCPEDPCKENPKAPGCPEDPCKENPKAPGCPEIPCKENPKAPGCPEDPCKENPKAPGCPEDPCKNDPIAEECPTNPNCNDSNRTSSECTHSEPPHPIVPSSPEGCSAGEEYNKNTDKCESFEPLNLVYCKDKPKDPNCIDTVNTALGGEKIPNQYLVLVKDDIANNTLSLRIALQELTDQVRSLGAKVLYTYENTISGFALKAPNAQVLDQVVIALRADRRVGVIEQDQTIVAFTDTIPNGIKRVDGGLVNMGATDGSGSADTDVDIAIIDMKLS